MYKRQILYWDGNDTTANADGGAGTWNTNSSLNWDDAATAGASVVWPALGGTDDDAVFGGTAGTVTIAGGVTVNDITFNTTGYLIQSSTLTLNGTTPTITTGAGISATISSDIAGTVGLTESGAGTLILSGGSANTYTGNVAVNGGTLQIGKSTALGVVNSAVTKVTVASGATVDFNGIADATYGYTISGTGVGGNGALVNNGSAIGTTSAQASNIRLAANATIGGTGNWALLTSAFGATNLDLAGFTLTKSGSNTISLASTTTTAGAIRVSGGTLALGVSGGTGVNGAASSLLLDNTSGVSISLGQSASIGSLAGGGTTGGNVALGANTLTVGALGTNTSYAGVISGSGALTKTGNGTLNLTGAFVSGQSIRFGTTSGGLTAAQLLLITVNGGGFFALDANGYLVTAGAPSLTTLYSDNFDGLASAVLNGTTPDITTAGAKWVAMQGGTTGAVYANGTIDVSGGTSAARGGSATLAFTPQNGFIYTLDLSATGLNSTASHTTANRLYFGFAAGQSAANGTANQLQVGSATVTGKVTEGYMTLVGYTGANGDANRTYNSTGSEAEWLALPGAFGGNINMRIVLDTSSPAWTATWYAKQPATNAYLVTRATEVVADKVITSIGFGLAQFTSGRVTGFSLIRETEAVSSGYNSWSTLNGADPNLNDDHDNDGVSNGVEYFLSGNADTTGFTPLPILTAGSITWPAASINAGYAGVYDIHFTVETSETLEAGSWVTAPLGTGAGTVSIPFATPASIRNVKYTFPTTGPKKFARLKVTGP